MAYKESTASVRDSITKNINSIKTDYRRYTTGIWESQIELQDQMHEVAEGKDDIET